MPKIGKDNFRIKGQYVEVEIWYENASSLLPYGLS